MCARLTPRGVAIISQSQAWEGVARPEPRPLPLGAKWNHRSRVFLININLLCDLANPLLTKTDKRTATLTNSYVMFTTVKEWDSPAVPHGGAQRQEAGVHTADQHSARRTRHRQATTPRCQLHKTPRKGKSTGSSFVLTRGGAGPAGCFVMMGSSETELCDVCTTSSSRRH